MRGPRSWELDVCLIGAQKAGSSSLADWLREHPSTCVSRVKESHFWASSIPGAPDPAPRDVETWFREQFHDASDGQLLVDASTSYSMAPQFEGVPARLHRHNPEMRFLYVLRDPVDRLESHLAHSYRKGAIDEVSMAEIVRRPVYLDRSRYHFQISKYLEHFDAARVHLVVFEELVSSPDAELARIEEFLGISGGSGHLPASNVSAERPGVTELELALTRRGLRLPERLKHAARRRWGRSHASGVLSDEDRWQVRAALEADRRALEAAMGRQLPWER